MYDFIPDTHGQRELLEALRAQLGYRRTAAGWRRHDAARRLVFLGDVRAVHAAWDDDAVARFDAAVPTSRLGVEGHLRSAKTDIGRAIEALTCGPEVESPEPHDFTDKGGHRRTCTRIRWWRAGDATWRDIAVSVPDLSELPDESVPGRISAMQYPADAAPVLFGRYRKSWDGGPGPLAAANAFCHDYSAALDGPLVCYRHDAGEPLDLSRLVVRRRCRIGPPSQSALARARALGAQQLAWFCAAR